MIWSLLKRHRRPACDASDLAKSYVRTFASEDGQVVLDHLLRMTLDQALGPHVSDAHLRHFEGQRAIVKYIINQTTKDLQ